MLRCAALCCAMLCCAVLTSLIIQPLAFTSDRLTLQKNIEILEGVLHHQGMYALSTCMQRFTVL